MQRYGTKTISSFLAFIFLTLSLNTLASEWKLEKSKQGVVVYSQKTDSGYKEVRVTTTVKAHPRSLVSLLNDVSYSSTWMHNCIKVEVLEEISASDRIINSFFAAPWPVKDRDMVIRTRSTILADSVTIEITDNAEHIAPHPDYVRMQNMYGVWQASLLETGLTEITYTGGGNPGGNLPIFIADKELISSMFNTFRNLQDAITLPEYQSSEITD